MSKHDPLRESVCVCVCVCMSERVSVSERERGRERERERNGFQILAPFSDELEKKNCAIVESSAAKKIEPPPSRHF